MQEQEEEIVTIRLKRMGTEL